MTFLNGEDEEHIKKAMEEINLDTAKSTFASNIKEAINSLDYIGI